MVRADPVVQAAPGGPAGPGGNTGAFARFGSLTPAAGLAAVKRASAGGLSTKRNRALLAIFGVLALVALAAVIVVPRLMGPTDPGCKEYAGPALAAYNKTINDLNAQSSQATLSADMTAAVSSLTSAVGKAQQHDRQVRAERPAHRAQERPGGRGQRLGTHQHGGRAEQRVRRRRPSLLLGAPTTQERRDE